MFLRIGIVLIAAALLFGCGDDGASSSTTDSDSTSTTSTSTSAPTTSSTGSSTSSTEAPTTSSSTTSTTASVSTSSTFPGEPFDIVPATGIAMAVVGVEFDDVLNVRSGPGTSFEIVDRLGPTATMLSAGEGRLLTGSIWYRVGTGSANGWVNSSFTGQLGGVDDVTSQVVARVGEIPVAETMLELGQIVADARASIEPQSRITVTIAPTVGDLGEVTYDVVGIGDDSVLGERLHVFGQPTESGDGFSLMAVEAEIMCIRGVTPEGICI